MKKAQRLAHINERAYELAESGTCRNWQMIETKIRAEGYEDARGGNAHDGRCDGKARAKVEPCTVGCVV